MVKYFDFININAIFVVREIKFMVITIICALTFFSSCQSSEKNIYYTLNDQQIIEILVDISIARAVVAPLPIDMGDSIRIGYYEQIADIHQVEPQDIDELLEQLSMHPDRFQHLMSAAGDTIRARNEKREENR